MKPIIFYIFNTIMSFYKTILNLYQTTIISFYKSYFKPHQKIIVNDVRLLSILNKYDFYKYLVNESNYSYGNIQASFHQYIMNLFSLTWYDSVSIKIHPINKSYFYDTKYNMYGYITYDTEYLTQLDYSNDIFTSYKGIIFHLDTFKSKYTFREYFKKIYKEILIKTKTLNVQYYYQNYILRTCPLKVNNMLNRYQLSNNYFPATIYILVAGNLDYVYGLATVINKSVKIIDISTFFACNGINLRYLFCDCVVVINNVGTSLDNIHLYHILSTARYVENCVLIMYVKNYNEVKNTKLLNYMTGYTVHAYCT